MRLKGGNRMKVLAIAGSPRKGNTDAMLEQILKGAAGKGAEIELVRLWDEKIEPCRAVCDCFEIERKCPIKDGMAEVINKMLDADAIVFGSPDYFKNVSGIMKNFIDRTNGICGKLKGKKAAVVAVGAQDLQNVQFCENALIEFAKGHEMQLVGSVKAKADKAGEVLKNKKVMQECFELGEKLVSD